MVKECFSEADTSHAEVQKFVYAIAQDGAYVTTLSKSQARNTLGFSRLTGWVRGARSVVNVSRWSSLETSNYWPD
jgi:hypothetical protein